MKVYRKINSNLMTLLELPHNYLQKIYPIPNSQMNKSSLKELKKTYLYSMLGEIIDFNAVDSFFNRKTLPKFKELLNPFRYKDNDFDEINVELDLDWALEEMDAMKIHSDSLVLWSNYYKEMYKIFPKKHSDITRAIIEEIEHKNYPHCLSFASAHNSIYYDQHFYINVYNALQIIPQLLDREKALMENLFLNYLGENIFNDIDIAGEREIKIMCAQELIPIYFETILKNNYTEIKEFENKLKDKIQEQENKNLILAVLEPLSENYMLKDKLESVVEMRENFKVKKI